VTPVVFDPAKHCGAKTNPLNGERPCRRVKGWGTDHKHAGQCRLHGGTSPNGEKHAHAEAAQQALERLGRPLETNPQQALLDLVSEAAGNVYFLRLQAGALGIAVTARESEAQSRTDRWGVHSSTTLGMREDVRAIVKLYGDWCDRLAKYAAEAIKAGIAERAIALIETQADLVARVIVRALEGLPDEEFERRKSLAMNELVTFEAIPAGSRN
jgi:hypothetical protein